MPTLPIRFITSRGPSSSPPLPEDILFLGSAADFTEAKQLRDLPHDEVKAVLPTHEFVIYRMWHAADGFNIWLQGADSTGDDPITQSLPPAIGYAVYAVPKGLVTEVPTAPKTTERTRDAKGEISELSRRVLELSTKYGQQGDPGHGGP